MLALAPPSPTAPAVQPGAPVARTAHAVPPATEAAVISFRLLESVLPGWLLGHETADGGLICEHRRDGCRPGFYRVTPAGAIEPDTVLDRRTLRFIPALLPAGLR